MFVKLTHTDGKYVYCNTNDIRYFEHNERLKNTVITLTDGNIVVIETPEEIYEMTKERK